MYYINDFDIGYEVNQKIKITDKLHSEFIKLTGDNSPIHTDIKFSKNNNYKAPIGFAFLIPALLSRIYGTVFPGGSELCLSQNCEFRAVYFVGDTLFFNLKVVQKNVEFKLITIDVTVNNQFKKTVFSGKSIMKLILCANESI